MEDGGRSVIWPPIYRTLRTQSLEGAFFGRAQLRGASFENADLTGADFRWADLREAKGLTRDQLEKAITNETTLLPSGFAA